MEYLQILKLINVVLSMVIRNRDAAAGWSVATFAFLILFLKGM
jgi:hypothetical protein